MDVKVRRAEGGDIDAVAALFEAYCRFYHQDPRDGRAAEFIAARMRDEDSVIFVAEVGDAGAGPVGFVQLYPKWSSTTMRRDWILNDLFVEEGSRRHGVARALMETAVRFVRGTSAASVSLKTQTTNTAAQALYESLGWARDDAFLTYTFRVLE